MIVFQSINSSMELISTWNKTKQSNIRFSISSTYSGDLTTNSKYDNKDIMAKMTNIILWYQIAMEWSQGKKTKNWPRKARQGGGAVTMWRRWGGREEESVQGEGEDASPGQLLPWSRTQGTEKRLKLIRTAWRSAGSEHQAEGKWRARTRKFNPSGGGWCQERLLVLNPKQWP